MGCSPSKGKLFSKPENGSALENTPMDEAPPDCVKSGLLEEENTCPKVEESVPLSPSQEYTLDKDQTVADTEAKVEEKDVDALVTETVTEVHEINEVNGTQRRQKNKKKQRSNGKLRKSSITKVDFPPHMVRAHQAAYAFLNPNISKFEGLLELLDQAAHTQLSLQPMMSALVLRFEEVNQALEEMAEEGELMLKEHGDYMALPSGMMGTPVLTALKSSRDKDSQRVPPPDLLQQLLKHSTEKMRHVGGSFQALGDTTLEEAVEYFASLSKLLFEKIKAKHIAEERIALVLSQVEAATVGKSNREDSALHSEDSGIGGENDSLTGSDRQRRHRGSAGSGSSASGANVQAVLPSNSTVEHNEEEEEGDYMDEEDDDIQMRKRSNSSPPDPSQAFLYIHEMLLTEQRPQTAASEREVQYSDITGKHLAGHETKLDTIGVRRHTVCGAGSNKRLSKTNPVYASQAPKPPSVRRLINSFSGPGQNPPANIRRPRKTTPEGTQASSWPESREDPDEENLPPPPPEVLLDDSFQVTESISGNEKAYQNNVINKRQGLHHRLKTTVELLPNRTSIKPKSLNLSSVCSVYPETTGGAQELVQRQEATLDLDSSLYQQARTIIHIRSAAGPQQKAPQRSDSADDHEGDRSFSLPVIAPPVSRVRLPPSCPPVHHRYPSPPVRPQSSNSRPNSPKTITRASDNPVEQIIPSLSFKDARSVFCQNETVQQPFSSAGASVLPRPWGEGSRGRQGNRGMDSPRRTQSDHRPTITIRTQAAKHDHTLAATGQ